ncbi:MAG: PAS domain S-box protein [Dehalococcoidia bacterium]|nr:MAG: PAS domain S-box protein [Dehalococcoidia bacterium]
MEQRVRGRLLEAVRSVEFLAAIAMFLVAIPLHYPEQLMPFLEIEAPSSVLGLERLALERLFLLLPITYLGFLFGMKAGLTGSGLALVIMLPNALLISEYRADALGEVGGVVAAGAVINVGFERLRRERERRRLVGEKLRVSEERYREIFENAHDAIWLQDMQGRITMANKACAEITGYAPEELVGMKVRRFLTEDPLNKAREIRRRLLAGETIDEPYEQEIMKRDGSPALLWLTPSLITSQGWPTGFQFIARDITEQAHMQENLDFYLQQVTRAQEHERQRIAQELHDETAQSLMLMAQRLDSLASSANKRRNKDVTAELQEVRGTTIEALMELRRLAQDLRPRILDDMGLVPALEWLADDLTQQDGIEARVEVDGTVPRMSEEGQLLLFRIAQEALRNVGKHSGASEATLSLRVDDDRLEMRVVDNGHGFTLPKAVGDLAATGKLGLLGMHERARLLGGTLDIRSERHGGTTVVVELPVSVMNRQVPRAGSARRQRPAS